MSKQPQKDLPSLEEAFKHDLEHKWRFKDELEAKLCAGSLLGKLKKQGLVSHNYVREKWVFALTERGRQEMARYEVSKS